MGYMTELYRRPTTPETFWARTEVRDGCLVWTGHTTGGGYGRTSWGGRQVYAHRLSFFLRTGRWPAGLLRHLCNNPPCVLHVVEGTQQENIRDSLEAGTNYQSKKTHCPQGHLYDAVNTYVGKRGGRQCRACNKSRTHGSTTTPVRVIAAGVTSM